MNVTREAWNQSDRGAHRWKRASSLLHSRTHAWNVAGRSRLSRPLRVRLHARRSGPHDAASMPRPRTAAYAAPRPPRQPEAGSTGPCAMDAGLGQKE